MGLANWSLDERRILEMKVGVLLESVGHPEKHPLIKVVSHDLKSDGESFMVESARDRNRGNPRHVHGYRMDIG